MEDRESRIGNRDPLSSIFHPRFVFFGSSGFTVKEYSPQRHSAATPQPKVGKAGFTAEAQSTQRFIISNSPLRDLSVSAVQTPTPPFSTSFPTEVIDA
jgi:hypothetical protein